VPYRLRRKNIYPKGTVKPGITFKKTGEGEGPWRNSVVAIGEISMFRFACVRSAGVERRSLGGSNV